MPIVGRPLNPWETGRYVFADEGKLLGRALSVVGLDVALDVAAARRGSFPDIAVDGMDGDLQLWTNERARAPGEQWDFVIRDNVKKRWVRLKGAFVVHSNAIQPSCVWAINAAEPAAGAS
jgi:hypothetical protein